MAHIIPNSFTSWELTEEELTQGSILTIAQIQVIQSQRAGIAEEKLYLELDPLNPSAFIQAEASLSGQLKMLDYLLETSDAYIELQKQVHLETPAT